MSIVVRIRTQFQTVRLQNVNPNDKISLLRERIQAEHKIDTEGRPFTKDPSGSEAITDSATIRQLGLVNGDMNNLFINLRILIRPFAPWPPWKAKRLKTFKII